MRTESGVSQHLEIEVPEGPVKGTEKEQPLRIGRQSHKWSVSKLQEETAKNEGGVKNHGMLLRG